MTGLPTNHDMFRRAAPVVGVPPPAAPSREIREIVRKTLPDGRVIEWVTEVVTCATPDMNFVTLDVTHAPGLDCPCTPFGPDDVTVCFACARLVCVRRHSATCALCGLVFGSCCLLKQRLAGMIVCKECAFQATASLFRKILRWVMSVAGRILMWRGRGDQTP